MKKTMFWIVNFILLIVTMSSLVVAESWYIKGGDSGLQNFSDTMDQGFYYQYDGNESNLTIGTDQCSPSDTVWSSDGACVQPGFANREDFSLFNDNGYLWWHPSSSEGGVLLKFTAPVTTEYFFNVSFFKYVGGNVVNFSVKLQDDTVLLVSSLAGGTQSSFQQSVNLTALDTLHFIAETPDGDSGDSAGIILNISSVPSSNFTVQVKNVESTNINNFTAIVNGTSYSTTTGTATTNIIVDSGVVAVVIEDAIDTNGVYFNKTTASHDTVLNLNVIGLYQAEITFNATEKYTGTNLSGDFYKSTTVQESPAKLLAVFQNISFVNQTYSPFINTTNEFTFTALQNTTGTQFLNVTNAVLNITPKSIFDNSTINTFTGYVQNTATNFNETINSTNGFVEFPLLLNLNYTVYVESSVHAINKNNIATVNVTTSPTTQSFFLYDINTIQFTFKDEETDTQITWENVTIDLIGSLQSYNYTTTDGNYTATLLQPSDYAMRYSAPSYNEKFYYFTPINQSYNQLTLYLLNSSSSSNITVNVIDQTTAVVEGALVIAQRYYIAENAYKTVEIAKTNFEGKALMSLTMYDEFYKFIIEYDDEVVFISTPSYITDTDLLFQVTIGEELLEDYDEYTSISGKVTYNNATQRFTFTFNDADNLATQFCLHIKRLSYSGSTIINSSCTTTSSGSITLGFIHLNATTYEAAGTFIRDSISYVIDVFSITTDETTTTGVIGLILQVILTIAFAFMFMYVSPILTPIGVGLSLILGRLFILTSLSWPVLLGFMAGMIILTLWLGRND